MQQTAQQKLSKLLDEQDVEQIVCMQTLSLAELLLMIAVCFVGAICYFL